MDQEMVKWMCLHIFKYFQSDFFIHRCRVPQCYTRAMASVIY